MKHYRWIFYILILFTCLMIGGCRQNETVKDTVRIAHFANITHAQAIIARENMWFENIMGNDIDVQYLLFNAGSSEIEAFFSEQVDIGYIGPIPAINGHIKSRGDIIIIAGASNQGAHLVVSNTSNIKELKDLNHKRIAIPQIGNTQHVALLHLLSQNDMADISHGGLVDLVVSKNAEVAQKMRDGDLDAAYLPEPWSTLLVHEGLGTYLEDENYKSFNASTNTAVVIVHRDFLKKYPERVESFLKVHIEATRLLESHTSETVNLIRTFIDEETGQELSSEIISDSLSKMVFTVDIDSSVILNYLNIFHQEGFTQEAVNLDDLIQFERLNSVLKSMDLQIVE